MTSVPWCCKREQAVNRLSHRLALTAVSTSFQEEQTFGPNHFPSTSLEWAFQKRLAANLSCSTVDNPSNTAALLWYQDWIGHRSGRCFYLVMWLFKALYVPLWDNRKKNQRKGNRKIKIVIWWIGWSSFIWNKQWSARSLATTSLKSSEEI